MKKCSVRFSHMQPHFGWKYRIVLAQDKYKRKPNSNFYLNFEEWGFETKNKAKMASEEIANAFDLSLRDISNEI